MKPDVNDLLPIYNYLQLFFNIYNLVFLALSVNHLVDAKEASAGVWTSMAFSCPAQTTAEETFSVKTWKTATTASENEADRRRRPHPLHPFIATT